MIRIRKTNGSSIYQIFLIAHPTPKKWEVWRIKEFLKSPLSPFKFYSIIIDFGHIRLEIGRRSPVF